jgi:predicted dehydrogenase
VAAAQAGKHLVLEKPTGLDVAELVRIRDAVQRAGVRTIVSFELHYNPFSHHPFRDEIDELIACVREGRETSMNVFDAQKTMEVCLAADRSAALGGQPIALPLIRDDGPKVEAGGQGSEVRSGAAALNLASGPRPPASKAEHL